VQALPPPPRPCLVLSFDFDGTLHHPAEQPPVAPEFFAAVERLRRERHALWGINTGRAMPHMIEGFAESRFPFLPDWVVVREREILLPNAFGRWVGHAAWNRRCEAEHARLFRRARKLLKAIRHEIEEHTGARWITEDGDPAGIIARTEEEMEWIAGRVTELAGGEPLLGWQRNSIYLRFGHRHFQKGSSLAEIARLHGLEPAQVFAAGDSHNDLDMLDRAVAAMLACPANAVPEVRARVLAQGGHAAAAPHSAGVVEALHHWFPGLAAADAAP
jgi:hydroxymethylpyrimidine pyrophosphatase-like HAD family hydrolase